MAKIVLNDLTNTYNPTSINENFARIESEFQDKVLYRNNPFGEANTLESDIDANSKSIYNIDNLSTWSISFSNIRVVWGPANTQDSASIDRLSRYGADLDGDLKFTAARRIIAPSNAGPSLVNSLTAQSGTANTATTLVVKPSGTSTVANTLYSNNSLSSVVYQAVSYGVSGADNIIETFGLSAATPNIGMNVGVSNRVVTFKPSSINFLGGSRDYGALINYNAGLSNFGGANAVSHNTTNTLNIDSICTSGVIASFMSATPTNVQVENILRPLYCMFSELIADLRAKKAI